MKTTLLPNWVKTTPLPNWVKTSLLPGAQLSENNTAAQAVSGWVGAVMIHYLRSRSQGSLGRGSAAKELISAKNYNHDGYMMDGWTDGRMDEWTDGWIDG